jgi:hypothetical protein
MIKGTFTVEKCFFRDGNRGMFANIRDIRTGTVHIACIDPAWFNGKTMDGIIYKKTTRDWFVPNTPKTLKEAEISDTYHLCKAIGS